MADDWLKTLNKCQERLLLIAARLERYSKSFYTIGNYNMGDSLTKESSELELLSETIGKAAGEILSEQLKTSQANSANVLKAALAGIGIANKDMEISKENKKGE